MTAKYPNDFDIYGFSPVEKEYGYGDYVVDKRTGVVGRVRYVQGVMCVKIDGAAYELEEVEK